jgi:uncharacterized surface protein with fasciclin (FAS1) repeats
MFPSKTIVANAVNSADPDQGADLSRGGWRLRHQQAAKLWLMMNGSSNILVKDEKGAIADITILDVHQSNGVIDVVDQVLIPG